MNGLNKTIVVIRSAPSSSEFKRGLKLAEQLKASGQNVQLCLLSAAVLATEGLANSGWELASHKDSIGMRAIDLSKASDAVRPADYAEIVDLLISNNAKVIGAF